MTPSESAGRATSRRRAVADPPSRAAGPRREVGFVFVLFLFLFTGAALVGYDPYQHRDWLGAAGAGLAKLLAEMTFGRWGALAVPLSLGLVAAGWMLPGRLPVTRLASAAVLAGFFTGFAFAFIRSWLNLDAAGQWIWTGLVPAYLSQLSVAYFGRGGAILAFLALVSVAAVLLAKVSAISVARFLFYTAPVAVGRAVAGFVKPILSSYPSGATEEEGGPEEEEAPEYEVDLEEEEVEDAATGVAIPKPEAPPRRDDALEPVAGSWEFPPFSLLTNPPADRPTVDPQELEDNARRLEAKLDHLGVTARVVDMRPGPVITRYVLEPAADVKVARIASLADDIAMALRAKGVRILAPIPGEAAVGIEIPNRRIQTVFIREALDSEEFRRADHPLTLALGKDASGAIFCADLAQMPHLLIAGATGSGKSVCMNALIISLLFRAHPRQVRLVMIDPKKIELSLYGNLSQHHLIVPPGLGERVVTVPENAVKALQSVHLEMERRYDLFAQAGVRDLEEFNRLAAQGPGSDGVDAEPLPYIVVIIDELADLMMTVRREFEELVVRLAQMARAVGIHLVVATQRPSVDVVTGLIKANFPARIAFKVAQKVDSRTILDANGAESLLGRGDMLFMGPGSAQPVRLHGALVSTREVERVVQFVAAQPPLASAYALPDPAAAKVKTGEKTAESSGFDDLFNEAAKIVVRTEQGSVSVLQRRLRIGYARAARLIDELEQAGIVGPFDGSKARQVLVTLEQLRDQYGIE